MLELFDDGAEAQVLRAKIVSPFADAVRLVDDEERGFGRQDLRERLLVRELLRRQEEELGLTSGEGLEHVVSLCYPQSRIERRGVADVRLSDRVDLITLQRQQRRDDDGGPGHEGTSNLVDAGLARAGWHH